jgi:regulator of protease activity HflC (stomatin/prohibitin superfamily)
LLSALRKVPLDALLRHREEIQERLTAMMDRTTELWGMKVTLVEVKDVELPESMRRSMAKEAEAERERRAKIVNAQGELEAASALTKAAAEIEEHPSAMRLRELATLVEIAAEKNSTIIFPLPIELQQLAASLADGLTADLGRRRPPVDLDDHPRVTAPTRARDRGDLGRRAPAPRA